MSGVSVHSVVLLLPSRQHVVPSTGGYKYDLGLCSVAVPHTEGGGSTQLEGAQDLTVALIGSTNTSGVGRHTVWTFYARSSGAVLLGYEKTLCVAKDVCLSCGRLSAIRSRFLTVLLHMWHK